MRDMTKGTSPTVRSAVETLSDASSDDGRVKVLDWLMASADSLDLADTFCAELTSGDREALVQNRPEWLSHTTAEETLNEVTTVVRRSTLAPESIPAPEPAPSLVDDLLGAMFGEDPEPAAVAEPMPMPKPRAKKKPKPEKAKAESKPEPAAKKNKKKKKPSSAPTKGESKPEPAANKKPKPKSSKPKKSSSPPADDVETVERSETPDPPKKTKKKRPPKRSSTAPELASPSTTDAEVDTDTGAGADVGVEPELEPTDTESEVRADGESFSSWMAVSAGATDVGTEAALWRRILFNWPYVLGIALAGLAVWILLTGG